MHYRSATLLFATLAVGCLSGQTGSPDCVGGSSCVCDRLYSGGALLRVHVTSYEAGQLEATVDEVFDAQGGNYGISVGDRVGGSVTSERPCTPQAPSEISVGSELLVTYNPGAEGGYPNCDPFQSCASTSCAKLSEPALTDCWNDCSASTAQTCAELREAALSDGVFGFAVPWSDPLSFGDGHELPLAEVWVMTHDRTCLERFPPTPGPPCDDTRGSWSCAAATHDEHDSSAPYWSACLGFIALVYGVRRARRQGAAAAQPDLQKLP